MSGSTTIHRRLVVLAVAVALPLGGLAAFGVYSQFVDDRAHALQQLAFIKDLNADRARAYLAETREKLERLAHLDAIREMRAADVARVFESLHLTNPDAANIRLLDTEHRVVASMSEPHPEALSQLLATAPYRAASAAEGFAISEPYQGVVTRRWSTLLSMPVTDASGVRRGTLVMPLNVQQVAETFNLAPEPRGMRVGIVHRNGTIVLSRPDAAIVGSTLPGFAALAEQLARGRTNGIELTDDSGMRRVVAASPLTGTPWIAFASLPADEIYREARADLAEAVAAAIIVIALGAFLVARHTRAIEEPIMALAATARAQAAGQADTLAPVRGPAEIAETARAFNEMLAARRRAEASLEESEKRYRTVVDQSGQMVYDLDLQTRTMQWFGTTAIPAITGLTLEEFQNVDLSRWEEMIHPDDRARATAEFNRAISSRMPFVCEYRFRHKDGSYRTVEDFGVCFFDEQGKPMRMLGRMSDITARKQAEAARQDIEKKLLETQKLESLGVLAGGIAHDFNNLLTAILGHVTLARHEAPANWPGINYLAQVEKASYRAADLCKQMLAYSGRGRFVIARIDLNHLIQDTEQLLRVSISKRATLNLQLAAALPSVQADATQIRQVIMNLVINASEALEERTGTITVATGRERLDQAYLAQVHVAGDPTPGDYVFFEVCDTGAGMTPETLARIFDPFFTTKFTGRGLGLAAVLGIIRGHRGAIKVYSEPGRGTTFKVMLPAVAGAPESVIVGTPADAWKGRGTVLVVDDEEAVRTVAAGMLGVLGFTTETANDGASALEIFSREPTRYKLVLLDLTMPRMDGEEAFRRLRQIRADVRVVLMSGFNRADATGRFSGKGIAGFVQKPFGIETLTAEIRRIMEQ